MSQESRDKVAALNRLRTVEGNMARMQDQLEEEEENKNNIERQVSSVQQQVSCWSLVLYYWLDDASELRT